MCEEGGWVGVWVGEGGGCEVCGVGRGVWPTLGV